MYEIYKFLAVEIMTERNNKKNQTTSMTAKKSWVGKREYRTEPNRTEQNKKQASKIIALKRGHNFIFIIKNEEEEEACNGNEMRRGAEIETDFEMGSEKRWKEKKKSLKLIMFMFRFFFFCFRFVAKRETFCFFSTGFST